MVKPKSPWKASPKDRAKEAAIFLGTIAATSLVVLFSPLSGKLGLFVTFFFLYALAEATSSYIKFGTMTAKDSAIKVVMACGAVLAVLPIVSIL